MIELRGKYNIAKVYTDNLEKTAMAQIIDLCNQEAYSQSKIRIMPDTHAGAGCTIGTTMTITDKICPSLVGVDIGCGMQTVKISEKDLDFEKVDNIIRNYIPSGFNTRQSEHKYSNNVRFEDLVCKKQVNIDRAKLSIGTLGGGNHFWEINEDEIGNIYLVVHSGSRNLGKQVAEYYQELAYKRLTNLQLEKQEMVKRLRKEGREKDIETELKKIAVPKINKQLAYVQGQDYLDYLNDMKIVQSFATLNRKAMMDELVSRMGLTVIDSFATIHNYIDTNTMLLRKGAISAEKGEKVLIPINMRDGSLICTGKGNLDWNNSAPHGAGRLMSRSVAKQAVSLEEFKESMNGIWTTSVSESTLDESPMAYKPMSEIMENIKDTVDIESIIKPLYNFKASS